MRMYVGNLDFRTTDTDLRTAFTAYGLVFSANVMRNAVTGQARGFGFVEMKDGAEARLALSCLDGSELLDRTLTVKQERVL